MCNWCSIHKGQCIFSYLRIDRINISKLQNITIFTWSVFVRSYLSNESNIMLQRWSVEHNTSKYRLEKCQFNIGSYGTHSVLDTPDLWANIVLYVTVELPIGLLFNCSISVFKRHKCVRRWSSQNLYHGKCVKIGHFYENWHVWIYAVREHFSMTIYTWTGVFTPIATHAHQRETSITTTP